MKETWITDYGPSARFVHYTRANADEVGPDPFSPLGWSLGWVKGCIPGVADGFVNYGVVHRHELDPEAPEVFGNWGGYFYNQLTLPRVLGVRMPGASPEAMDQAYFGDHPGVPEFEMKPEYEDPELAAKLAESLAWVMSADDYPLLDERADEARRFREERPDLGTLTDAELVARARAAAELVAKVWDPYCQACFAASVGPAAVAGVVEAIGRPETAIQLIAALGNVESADISVRMWEVGRIVAGSASLMAAFDRGVEGLLDRLRASDDPDASRFLTAFEDLIADYGYRGPNEWDMRAHSWETKPELALGMLDKLRHQDDDKSPAIVAAARAAERERLIDEIVAELGDDADAIGTLRAGVKAATVFFAAREKGKNACIRLLNEGKVALMELGQRLVERGVLDHPQQIFMLLDEEIDEYLVDPGAWLDTLREREADWLHLHELEPPYIIDAREGVPPISTWKPRGSARTDAPPAGPGDVLVGAPGAAGVATGRARIVLDPEDPGDLGPGDILVVHTTDPAWTPLFLAVDGVVCDVGAVASHAVIVSRELGVPCAVSVVDATRRIPDGATITVDGNTGRVTVEAVPSAAVA